MHTFRHSKNIRQYDQESRNRERLLTTLVSLTTIVLMTICHFVAPTWQMDIGLGGHLLEMYLTQLSLTFITISVTSVLSDKSATLYWINLVEDNLIHPRYHCFYAYVLYSFAALLICGVAILYRQQVPFLIFFVFNVVILTILTFSMMTIYFSIDDKQRRAEDEWAKTERLLNTPDKDRKTLETAYQDKESRLMHLKEYTLRAFDAKESDTISRNLDFYGRHCNAGQISYVYRHIQIDNLEFLEKLYQLFQEQYCSRLSAGDRDAWKTIIEDCNLINAIPDELVNLMMVEKSSTECRHLFEVLMAQSRWMLQVFCEKLVGKECVRDEIPFREFREIIRRDFLREQDTGTPCFTDYLDNQKEIDLLDEIFCSAKTGEHNELDLVFHELIKELPVRRILEIVLASFESGSHYYPTVFITTFYQFPIFAYMQYAVSI